MGGKQADAPTTGASIVRAIKEHDTRVVLNLLSGPNATTFLATREEGRSPMQWACTTGLVRVVERMLELGVSINEKDSYGMTGLNLACQNDQPEVASLLISKGADVCIQGEDGKSPLIWACSKGLSIVAVSLIDAGALLDVADKYLNTALHWAASRGLLDVVSKIVQKKASLDPQHNNKMTPLHFSCVKGHRAVAILLAKHGAATNIADCENRLPLHYAVTSNMLDVAACLLDHGSPLDVVDAAGDAPLHAAARLKTADMAVLLIERGAPLSTTNREAKTILHLAAEHGLGKVISAVIDKGGSALLNQKDTYGYTPLIWSCKRQHVACAEALLQAGADVAVKDNDGYGAVYWACFKGEVEVATVLVKYGASPQVDLRDGITPLHLLCFEGAEEPVRGFLKAGAKVNAVDKNSRTPLHYACLKGHVGICQALIDGGADVEAKDASGKKPLQWACEHGHPDAVITLIEARAELSVRDSDGLTVLLWASFKGLPDVVQTALKCGQNLDINATDSHGFSALHFGAIKGSVPVVECLLEHRVDVNGLDSGGKTPLHWAAYKGNETIVDLLISHGAKLLVEDKNGCTPLVYACHERNEEAALRLLQDAGIREHVGANKRTPLHLACERGLGRVALALVEMGADLACRDDKERTPLHFAAEGGHGDVAMRMVELGANPGALDEDGKSPLALALEARHAQTAARLLEIGSSLEGKLDLNTPDRDGKTLLHAAIELQLFHAARKLVELGAPLMVTDAQGKTPLHLACAFTPTSEGTSEPGVSMNNAAGVATRSQPSMSLSDPGPYFAIRTDAFQNSDGKNSPSKRVTSLGPEASPLAMNYTHTMTSKLGSRERPVQSNDLVITDGDSVDHDDDEAGPVRETNGKRKSHTATPLATPPASRPTSPPKEADVSALDVADAFAMLDQSISPMRLCEDVACLLVEKETVQLLQKQDRSQRIAAHYAAMTGRHRVLRLMLGKGCPVDLQDLNGKTPLLLSAMERHVGCGKLLLEHGASVAVVDRSGRTALHWACHNFLEELSLDMVEKATNKNALEIQDAKGVAPIHLAARRGLVEVCSALLARGVEVNQQEELGRSPLHAAVFKGHATIIRDLLEKGALVDLTDEKGRTALHVALTSGSMGAVAQLMDAGASLSIQNNEGLSPLHLAALLGYTDAAARMVARGADVAVRDTTRMTPLHMAAFKGFAGTTARLCDLGTDVNVTDGEDRTPLHWACAEGHDETVERLLQWGASVTCVDQYKKTPLHYACEEAHTECAEYLIRVGAELDSVESRDNDGKTPIDFVKFAETKEHLLEVARDMVMRLRENETRAASWQMKDAILWLRHVVRLPKPIVDVFEEKKVNGSQLLLINQSSLGGYAIDDPVVSAHLLDSLSRLRRVSQQDADAGAAMSPSKLAGTLYLGRYEVATVQHGSVMQAKDTLDQSKPTVALKFNSSLAGYLHERNILTRVAGPHVVKAIRDHQDEAGDLHCIVLEWGNRTLEHVRTSGVEMERRKRYACELIQAVAHIHERNIVHGDLRLRNAMTFGDMETVKLIDFAAAAEEDDDVPAVPAKVAQRSLDMSGTSFYVQPSRSASATPNGAHPSQTPPPSSQASSRPGSGQSGKGGAFSKLFRRPSLSGGDSSSNREVEERWWWVCTPEKAKALARKSETVPATRSADMWCLGVCLYELLSGHRLFTKMTQRETAVHLLRDESYCQVKGSDGKIHITLSLPHMNLIPDDRYKNIIHALLRRNQWQRPAIDVIVNLVLYGQVPTSLIGASTPPSRRNSLSRHSPLPSPTRASPPPILASIHRQSPTELPPLNTTPQNSTSTAATTGNTPQMQANIVNILQAQSTMIEKQQALIEDLKSQMEDQQSKLSDIHDNMATSSVSAKQETKACVIL
eukprot:Rmarinus@m.25053